tara:strand:+ start:353 stop:631 length:279 start_codon:yes stop_codon:yes gene_type:complete
MGFNRWKRAPSKPVPTRSWSPEEMKVIGFVMNKGISISISPDWKDEFSRWQIDIKIGKTIHVDPKRYTDENVYDKVVEYYNYYYDKYNKNNK